MHPPSGAGPGMGMMGPPHMGPPNSQVYDFPTGDDDSASGGKGKKKRETKKKAPKEPKPVKAPKTPKTPKGRAAPGPVGSSPYTSGILNFHSYKI